jgi:hypothetical protein
MSENIPGIDWPVNRMFPAFQTSERLNIYDIRQASKDIQLTISTLVGLINRPKPQVYLLFNRDDEEWLQEIPDAILQIGTTVSNDAVLHDLLATYRPYVKGMIIYDPNLLDSINVAATMAGQEDGIVVSPEQAEALRLPYNLAVLADLRVYCWANRTAVYNWACKHLLASASPRIVAGLHPTHVGGLRAFLVATRAFVYWLDSRRFLPDFRAGQQSERRLMRHILKSFAPGAVHLGWFIDEFSGVTLASEAALPVLASDHFTNLEVWTSIQPATSVTRADNSANSVNSTNIANPAISTRHANRVGARLIAPHARHIEDAPVKESPFAPPPDPVGAINRAPTRGEDAIYLSFTISDGDNLQYMQHKMLQLWHDPARERLPLGWTIAPVIVQAAPVMAAYYLRTATENSEFVAGPSGVGYMYPSRWPSDHLPNFLEQTGQLMQDMNLTVLEVLDVGLSQIISVAFGRLQAFRSAALQRAYVQALKPFGLRGILSGSGGRTSRWSIKEDIPILQNLGLAGSPAAILRLVRRAAMSNKQRPLFLNVYVEAWRVKPSQIEEAIRELGSAYIVVTPGTLLALIAQSAAHR